MAELKVKCPGCAATLKLKQAAKKIRCPRCETVIPVTENRGSSSQPSTKPSRSQDDFLDDFSEDELLDDISQPPPKASRKPSQRSGKKKRKPARSGADEINSDQLRGFGFTMIALGVGVFLLPLIGLQIKGLHALGPEGQAIGGICFFLLGGVVLLMSYGSVFGSVGEIAFKVIKWGALGVGGLIVLMIGLMLTLALANKFLPRNQQPVAPVPVARQPDRIPAGPARMGQPPEMSHRPGLQGRTGEPMPTGGPPFGPGGSGFGAGQMNRMEAEFARHGEENTVHVLLVGFDSSKHRELQTQLQELASPQLTSGSGGSDQYRIRMAPVEDIQALAERISFAKVDSVDAATRTITLHPHPSESPFVPVD